MLLSLFYFNSCVKIQIQSCFDGFNNSSTLILFLLKKNCNIPRLQLLETLKGHSQLMHMRIRYHILADLHVTRRA